MNKDFRYTQLKELRCDDCTKIMGKVYENDLEGTIILCERCGIKRVRLKWVIVLIVVVIGFIVVNAH